MTHSEVEFLDVDKTGLFHSLALSTVLNDTEACTNLLTALFEEFTPVAHSRVRGDSTIITAYVAGSFVAFNPGAGFADSVGFGEEGVPVSYAAHQPSHVDVIGEVRLESPFTGTVFNLTGLRLAGLWGRQMARTIGRWEEPKRAGWVRGRSR